jgi:hypothetical protein
MYRLVKIRSETGANESHERSISRGGVGNSFATVFLSKMSRILKILTMINCLKGIGSVLDL